MSDESPLTPYGSARDLPSFQELERNIADMNLLGQLLGVDAEQLAVLEEMQRQHRRITYVVDEFYRLLGPRNWVFTEDLSVPAMERLIDTNDPDVAEARLIDHYKEDKSIGIPLLRIRNIANMQPRMGLIRKALADFRDGRYYSTVLVLLSVMDGFVNDLDKADRKGLHARTSDELVAWDSTVGHHLGLSHAQRSFRKPFTKRIEEEVEELYRNGIMHGAVINFDNVVVATRAWNRLFAVVDWAVTLERRAQPVEPPPTPSDVLKQLKHNRDQRARLDEWHSYEYQPDHEVAKEHAVVPTCHAFLGHWHKQQWAPLAAHFMRLGSHPSSPSHATLEAKDLYSPHVLTSWNLRSVRHVAAAVAKAEVDLTVNGTAYRTELRWVRVDSDGDAVPEWEEGRWVLSLYGPSNLLKPEYAAN